MTNKHWGDETVGGDTEVGRWEPIASDPGDEQDHVDNQ